MGLNTNVVVIENVPAQNHYAFAKAVLEALNFKVVKEHQNLDWSDKALMLYQNSNTVAITHAANRLILEDYVSKLSYYNKPCVLQSMSRERTIGTVSISDTTDTAFYAIYKAEKHLSFSEGMEEFDLLLEELGGDIDLASKESCLVTDETLRADLEAFRQQFNYDLLFEQKFNVVEVVDLEATS